MNNMEIKVSIKDIPEVIEQLQQAEEKINNLQSKIDKAIKKLEYYNSGEALYYVPIQDITDILKEDK